MLTTASWGALIGVKSNTGCDNISPSLVKGSGKQSSFYNQWRVRPSYGEYRGKEWSVSNENFKFKIRKHPCVNCTERSAKVLRHEIQPQLKDGRSSWRIFRHTNHLFDLQEQLSSLNVKKNHRLFSSLARYRREVASHAYEPIFSLWFRAENVEHVNLCLC